MELRQYPSRARIFAFDPASVTVTTARELVDRHAAQMDSQLCPHCVEPSPCPTYRHAQQVLDLAGLEPSPHAAPAPRHFID